jgi:hypothetical protein
MVFRSHLTRGMDPANYWNRAILILAPMFGAGGVVVGLAREGSAWPGVEAAGAAFALWALTRELDPDRQSTALIAALAAGSWALAGFQVELLAMGGFVVMARILSETTGRRPLTTDLVVVAIAATAISFTPLGFATAFGIAVAIWVDERKAEEHNRQHIWMAPITAAGATVVASLTGTFSGGLPDLQPPLILAYVALALVAVVREPPQPTTLVDSRRKTFLRQDRVHAARAAVALVIVVGALISGPDALALAPLAAALALALGSSEVERRARPRL